MACDSELYQGQRDPRRRQCDYLCISCVKPADNFMAIELDGAYQVVRYLGKQYPNIARVRLVTTARGFNLQSTEFAPMSTSIVKLVRDVFPGTR